MDEESIVDLLNDPQASQADLIQVIEATDVDPHLRDGALNHQNLSDDAIEMLLIQGSDGLRTRILAGVQRATILRQWARTHQVTDRATVAMNPATPPDAVSHLVRDRAPEVRSNLVFHPGLSLAQVRRLALTDRDADVRQAARFALSTATGWLLRTGERWVASDQVADDEPG
jgi:hypothetical protein